MRISDWSSDVCSSDLVDVGDDEEEARAVRVGVAQQPALVDVAHDVLDRVERHRRRRRIMHRQDDAGNDLDGQRDAGEDAEIPEVVEVTRHRIAAADRIEHERSEEHTSELQSLMRISYAVFCLKQKTNNKNIY